MPINAPVSVQPRIHAGSGYTTRSQVSPAYAEKTCYGNSFGNQSRQAKEGLSDVAPQNHLIAGKSTGAFVDFDFEI